MSVSDWMSSSMATSGSLYPSSSFAYCSATDAKCSQCNADWLDAYLHTNSPPARNDICYGDGGCICLAVCTEPTRVSRVVDDLCPLFGGATTRALAFGAVGVAVCLCFAALAWLTRWCLNRFAPGTAASFEDAFWMIGVELTFVVAFAYCRNPHATDPERAPREEAPAQPFATT